MMIRIAKVKEIELVKKLPQAVKGAIEDTLVILDEMYGIDRDIENDLGGYVVVVENEVDIEKIKKTHLDIYTDIPELVEKIYVNKKEMWVKLSFILSSDYAIVVVGSTEIIQLNKINQ